MFEKEIRRFHEIEKQKAKEAAEEAKKDQKEARAEAEADFPGFVEDLRHILSMGRKSFDIYRGRMPRDKSAYLERLQQLFNNAGAKVSISGIRWVHKDEDMSGNYATIEYYGD